ncbi:MAG TPA: BMP family ABC transporter substrate-binding protein [Candidatus Acetothermia bacterium]|jgi:basic membrane protein A|nr:BMP family protein [Candidatus Bipolaricaulota bacterium]HDJ29547.1 BMP family ABC transporter substrate-binding protein [Candidatus Acetothermia bacterium]
MRFKKAVLVLMLIGIVVGSLGVIGAAKPFRVAFVMPSTINDSAWSQSMYDALIAIQNEMGKDNFQIDYSENMFVISDAAAAIRDYASQGYDLIIAHGSQYGSSLVDIAPDFPNVAFAWGSTANTFSDMGITNVFSYQPYSEQGGYVQGVLAAKLSQSGIIGVIGPIETGDAKRYTEGFKAGVLATNPNAKVSVTWTGSYSDVSLAAETARTMINAGADVLTGTSQMVVGAIGVAKKHGVLWFGYDVDQSPLAPKIVVSSVIVDWTVALKPMIESIKNGVRGGKIYTLDLANGGLKIAVNPEGLVGQTIDDIISGKIQINLGD